MKRRRREEGVHEDAPLINQLFMLFVMLVLNFLAGYFLVMIVLIFPTNVTDNLTKLYSTLFMVAVMFVVEFFTMIVSFHGRMHRRLWALLCLTSGLFAVLFSILVRDQYGVNQRDFALFTIEHHQMIISPASIVIDRIDHPIMKALVNDIIATQTSEIALLRSILDEL